MLKLIFAEERMVCGDRKSQVRIYAEQCGSHGVRHFQKMNVEGDLQRWNQMH